MDSGNLLTQQKGKTLDEITQLINGDDTAASKSFSAFQHDKMRTFFLTTVIPLLILWRVCLLLCPFHTSSTCKVENALIALLLTMNTTDWSLKGKLCPCSGIRYCTPQQLIMQLSFVSCNTVLLDFIGISACEHFSVLLSAYLCLFLQAVYCIM